jgi:hypothetical protein
LVSELREQHDRLFANPLAAQGAPDDSSLSSSSSSAAAAASAADPSLDRHAQRFRLADQSIHLEVWLAVRTTAIAKLSAAEQLLVRVLGKVCLHVHVVPI